MASKRSTPLAAPPDTDTPSPAPADTPLERPDVSDVVGPATLGAGTDVVRRDHRFAEGVRLLKVGGAARHLDERILLVLAGTIAPLGLVVVLLGWWGASHTPYVFEQVPYLISGGLLGLGLLFLGSFFYFAHWMTQLVKEHRVQSQAVLEALQRLQEVVAQGDGVGAAAAVLAANGSGHLPDVMVATERGTMAHRPACVVVAGKDDLRPVGMEDGLAPCKLCEPYVLGS